MNSIEMKVEALCKMITSENEGERAVARNYLKELMQAHEPAHGEASKVKISDVLLEIGMPDHILGYRYMERAIELAIEDRKNIDNITTILYPKLAKEFETTPSRVERAIRHAIEVAWDRGEFEVRNKYFGNTVSTERGNPTNRHFIAHIANVLR